MEKRDELSFDPNSLEIESFETTTEPVPGAKGTVFIQGVTCTSNCTGCGPSYECICGITWDDLCITMHYSCQSN